MSKKEYVYHEDLKKYRKFNVPINRVLIFFSHIFLGLIYHFQRSNKLIDVKKVKVKSYDNKKIKTIIYTPKKDLNKRCLFFIHGGGFVFNGSVHHYKLAKNMAINLNCKVIYVDYRLAPKYKFPVAPMDVFSVYKWVVENGEDLNINKEELIVMGDSAGGNLATVTTLLAKENNVVLPKINVLLYPVLTEGIETESYKKYDDTPMCNSKDCKKYGKYYYSDSIEEKRLYRVPYEMDIFNEFPSTYIEVAEYDCLHDDGVLFYNKLKEKNIKCELYEVKGAMHGYDIASKSQLVKDLIAKRVEFINNNM